MMSHEGKRKYLKVFKDKDGYKKQCYICKEIYPYTPKYFYRNKSFPSGLDYTCKKYKNKWDRKHHKLKSYGMSMEEYNELLKKQKYRCLICSSDLKSNNTHTDHDHKTGRVRGFLCLYCNSGLGKVKENPYILVNAIKFLLKNKNEKNIKTEKPIKRKKKKTKKIHNYSKVFKDKDGYKKQCHVCKEIYPYTPKYFCRNKTTSSGFDYICKKCKNKWHREHYILKKYGMSMEEYNELLKKQKNRCAICGSVFENQFHTHVDHDHKTDRIRGFLCNMCNQALGYFKENTYILVKAIKFLYNI